MARGRGAWAHRNEHATCIQTFTLQIEWDKCLRVRTTWWNTQNVRVEQKEFELASVQVLVGTSPAVSESNKTQEQGLCFLLDTIINILLQPATP